MLLCKITSNQAALQPSPLKLKPSHDPDQSIPKPRQDFEGFRPSQDDDKGRVVGGNDNEIEISVM